jgi:hypothetical protein
VITIDIAQDNEDNLRTRNYERALLFLTIIIGSNAEIDCDLSQMSEKVYEAAIKEDKESGV